MTKVKFAELVESKGIVTSTLAEVSKRYEGVNAAELLGLTETQLEKLEKKVTDKILAQAEWRIQELLLNGDEVEIKHTAKIHVYTSAGYKNEDGSPKKRVKATTRDAMNKKLNNIN